MPMKCPRCGTPVRPGLLPLFVFFAVGMALAFLASLGCAKQPIAPSAVPAPAVGVTPPVTAPEPVAQSAAPPTPPSTPTQTTWSGPRMILRPHQVVAVPRPTLFLFAVAADLIIDNPTYNDVADPLRRDGWLIVSLDPPAHGQDARAGESPDLT